MIKRVRWHYWLQLPYRSSVRSSQIKANDENWKHNKFRAYWNQKGWIRSPVHCNKWNLNIFHNGLIEHCINKVGMREEPITLTIDKSIQINSKQNKPFYYRWALIHSVQTTLWGEKMKKNTNTEDQS